MSYTIIIPARYASQRLPGKPLLDIAGKPMLQHTWERACESDASRVVIATDDERIAEAGRGFGGEVVMTASSHRSGSDRLQEAATLLGLDAQEIVVNVQADEPLLPASAIQQVATNLAANSDFGIATLCTAMQSQVEIDDPNAVKVVFDRNKRALYFSRSTIPHHANVSAGNCFRHIGLYAYRSGILSQFVSWPPSALELAENLEQLRALENGVHIHVDISNVQIPPGVDTPQDVDAVRQFLGGQEPTGKRTNRQAGN